MDVKDVKKLLDAVVSADVDEFHYESGDVRIVVKRGAAAHPVVTLPASAPGLPVTAAVPAPARQPESASDVPAAETAKPGAAASDHVDVTAPIVGTFYAAPAPDADPFVKVGDRVQKGAVLCIIEAMKLMNEIEAETSGVIAEILVQNEEPVEYGQALFRIDPD